MLEVRALGTLRASFHGSVLCFPTQKVPELLCFLLLSGDRPVGRGCIAETLWPMRPPSKARRSLSTALWRLRQTIRAADPDAQDLIIGRRQSLQIDPTIPRVFDVEEFEQGAVSALSGPIPCDSSRLERLKSCLRLYSGPLLTGILSDWCLGERERLQLLYMQSLKHLLRHHVRSGSFDAAIGIGRRLLVLDPLQEDIHRQVMTCFAASGRRALALEQYRRCRGVLHDELKIEPMPETQALHARIRSEALSPMGAALVRDATTPYEIALGRFRQALDALEDSWVALQAMESAQRERAISPSLFAQQ